MTLNIVTDPFGVFGDVFLKWHNYNQTNNPKIAKVSYVIDNIDKYDSYIIGSSVAATFDTEKINELSDSNFYNMYHNDIDTEYDRNLVSFLTKNDEVKNIVLVLSLQDANVSFSKIPSHYKVSNKSPFIFYCKHLFSDVKYATEKMSCLKNDTVLPQYFDSINCKTGCLDTCLKDAESIGSLDGYRIDMADKFVDSPNKYDLNNIQACVDNVSEIKKICSNADVGLTVIVAPASNSMLSLYTEQSVDEFLNKLSSVVDYWDFSISCISDDERYFYDSEQIRSDTSDMVIHRIFKNKNSYYPKNFGVFCKNGKYKTLKERKDLIETNDFSYYTNIPILMFHHFDENPNGATVLSYNKFEHCLNLLKQNNYNAVSFNDLIDYVKYGKPLPENPVVLTIDDGYLSNYEFVYPTLKKYNYCATIFVIGDSVGKSKYKNTDEDIIPHFDGDAMVEMSKSGIIDIGSHTYDMHRSLEIEQTDNVRTNITPFKNEPQDDYIDALSFDIDKQNELFTGLGLKEPNILAFPGGKNKTISNVVLKLNGYEATVTTNGKRLNTVVCGLSQTLINLGRLNVAEYTTDAQILEYLKK